MGRPFVGKLDLNYLLDILIKIFEKLFCCLNYILLAVKVWQTCFLIFALGNDIQLTLAAIFIVIVSKKCVKFCGSWMQCAALRSAFLLVFSNIRFLRHTCLFSAEIVCADTVLNLLIPISCLHHLSWLVAW
jgi:hypothetical protein